MTPLLYAMNSVAHCEYSPSTTLKAPIGVNFSIRNYCSEITIKRLTHKLQFKIIFIAYFVVK